MTSKKEYIQECINQKTLKLSSLIQLKEEINEGATGFDVLDIVESNYDLIYSFDKIEKSILIDLGTIEILDSDYKSLGNEIIQSLNHLIFNLEREIEFLNFKYDKL